jgi:hypothetical protein
MYYKVHGETITSQAASVNRQPTPADAFFVMF